MVKKGQKREEESKQVKNLLECREESKIFGTMEGIETLVEGWLGCWN
jgi:hypothetical protein